MKANILRWNFNNILKNQNTKGKEKPFRIEDLGEVKDRKIKIRKDIQELFTNPINTSVEDIDNFEEKEIKIVCKKYLV